MDATKSLIVNASTLPLSIIIVGIGDAEFTDMKILDGHAGLTDSFGNSSQRDLVVFVAFNFFKANPLLLAQKVLEVIPNQFCEYMKLIGKKPNPPIQIDLKNFGLFRAATSLGEGMLPENLHVIKPVAGKTAPKGRNSKKNKKYQIFILF